MAQHFGRLGRRRQLTWASAPCAFTLACAVAMFISLTRQQVSYRMVAFVSGSGCTHQWTALSQRVAASRVAEPQGTRNLDLAIFSRRAAAGFSDKRKRTPKSRGPPPSNGEKKQEGSKKGNEGESEKEKIVRSFRSGSTSITASKLREMSERTLAARQKRMEELAEYEEGLATIAKYGQQAAVMPKKVADRAAKRGVVIGGSFYLVMFGVFAYCLTLYQTQEIRVPPTLVAFVTLILVALSILGGSYGVMSASWDEDREGSVLGATEFARNVGIVGDGFRKMSMQEQWDKEIEDRRERRKLLAAQEEKKRDLLSE